MVVPYLRRPDFRESKLRDHDLAGYISSPKVLVKMSITILSIVL